MLYPSGIYNYFFVFIIFCAISRAQQQQQTKKIGIWQHPSSVQF